MPQQEVQDCADADSGAFLVESVEQVVSGADQVVSVGAVGAVVAERVVTEFIQGFRDRLAVFCPWLRGGCVGFGFVGLAFFSGVIDIGICADAVWWRCIEFRLRVPLGEEFLLERPGAEVLDVGPRAQVVIVDEHAVEAVGRGGYHLQGRRPALYITLRQLQASLARQLVDLMGVQPVQPGLGAADHQGRRRGERGVQLHLDPVDLVHDDDVAAQAREFQVPQPLLSSGAGARRSAAGSRGWLPR